MRFSSRQLSKKSISLSQACEGMICYKQATGKSENTISDYRVTFKKMFLRFESDQQIGAITRGEMLYTLIRAGAKGFLGSASQSPHLSQGMELHHPALVQMKRYQLLTAQFHASFRARDLDHPKWFASARC